METYGAGEPLLLLHGNSQSIYAFTNQIGELAKHFKVIAVDTRGQGKSKDHATGPLSYEMFADDMKAMLDSLHIQKTNILVWSDGGNTGLILAMKYPQYVNRLAVMGANLFPADKAVKRSTLNELTNAIDNLKARTDPRAIRQLRLFSLLLNEPNIDESNLKKIQCPSLIMAGENDIILEAHTRAIASGISDSKLVIFKKATHYAPVEKKKAFNQTVLKFFKSGSIPKDRKSESGLLWPVDDSQRKIFDHKAVNTAFLTLT